MGIWRRYIYHKIPRSKHATNTNILNGGIQETTKFNTKIYFSYIDEVHKGSPLLWLWFCDQMWSIDDEIWFDYAFQFAVMLRVVPPPSLPCSVKAAHQTNRFASNMKIHHKNFMSLRQTNWRIIPVINLLFAGLSFSIRTIYQSW